LCWSAVKKLLTHSLTSPSPARNTTEKTNYPRKSCRESGLPLSRKINIQLDTEIENIVRKSIEEIEVVLVPGNNDNNTFVDSHSAIALVC